MIPIIYCILLLLMLFTLYRAGIQIKRTNNILTPIVILAIVIYTLNEGLRFGRGIDYNLYGMAYEDMEKGGDNTWDFMFKTIAEILIGLGVSWQGYVVLMSFVFIVATICLLRNYNDVLPFALPLFVLFSIPATENQVRWYFGFSFILIGLGFLLGGGRKRKTLFLLFSVFACTFHLALAPIPMIFYIITLLRSPILKPLPTLIVYFVIAFFFSTEFMLQFVELVNRLSMLSEHFEAYGDKAEYWLTGGFADTGSRSAFPNILELVFLCSLIILGYQVIHKGGWRHIYAYNLFVIGLLVNPIANQIELVGRYDQTFFFFRAVVLACILEYAYRQKSVVIHKATLVISLFVFLSLGKVFFQPFRRSEEFYLYVWNRNGKSYQSMYDVHILDLYRIGRERKK